MKCIEFMMCVVVRGWGGGADEGGGGLCVTG